jgi:hypothetical protein
MARHTLRGTMVVAATAALLIPGPVASAAPVAPADPPSAQAPLWAGDTSLSPARNFLGLEQNPGRITVATHCDPTEQGCGGGGGGGKGTSQGEHGQQNAPRTQCRNGCVQCAGSCAASGTTG